MTLAKKTFILFLIAFVVQITVVVVILLVGYQKSHLQWRSVRYTQAEELSRTILLAPPENTIAFSYPSQIAIFDEQGVLVATNRGSGMRGGLSRSLLLAQRHPVYEGEMLIGYFATGELNFRDDQANQALLDSILLPFIISLGVSFIIALLAALYFSRSVAHPADAILRALERITTSDLPMKLEEQGAQEMVKIAHAVTELHKRLLHEKHVRAQWAQDLAHDLRTPVSSIKAQLEGMADGVLLASSSRFETTLKELARMEILIDDIEILMRLESPEMVIEKREVYPTSLFREIEERFEALMVPKEMKFSFNAIQEPFIADEFLLLRAISNIVSNAIKHSYQNSTISIDIEYKIKEVEIRISSRGEIIPENELPYLFDRLYRGEYGRNTPGSGLGLTIVKQIATLHEGTVSITSDLAMGTVVSLYLPVLSVRNS